MEEKLKRVKELLHSASCADPEGQYEECKDLCDEIADIAQRTREMVNSLKLVNQEI